MSGNDEATQPDLEDLEEPSTQKDPDEVAKAPDDSEDDVSHTAVGLGVMDDPIGEQPS